MLSVAIVDDETCFQEQLAAYIRRYADEHALEIAIDCFSDGLDLMYSSTPRHLIWPGVWRKPRLSLRAMPRPGN